HQVLEDVRREGDLRRTRQAPRGEVPSPSRGQELRWTGIGVGSASTTMVVDVRRWRREPIVRLLPMAQTAVGSATPRFGLKASMAITHVLLVGALSGIALVILVFLLRTRRRSRIRRSAIDSKNAHTLERRLRELQEQGDDDSATRE